MGKGIGPFVQTVDVEPFHGFAHQLVEPFPPFLQQTVVDGILEQGVLEPVGYLLLALLPENQSQFLQFAQMKVKGLTQP